MSKAITVVHPNIKKYIKSEPINKILMDMNPIPQRHYYRIIIGVNTQTNRMNYICWRKDMCSRFQLGSVDFDDPKQLKDTRFIFTEHEFENLLDYLTQFDDRDFYTIAELGRKSIDPISLLPVI